MERSTNGPGGRIYRRGVGRYLLLFALFCALFLIGLMVFSGCVTGSPFYLVKAARGQLQILCVRTPIDELLKDPALPEEKRKKLELVLHVQGFSRESLMLDTGDSFTHYSEIHRDAAAYNVIAAPATALEPHTYWFPIVGSVPYIGFFSEEEAKLYADTLKEQGLDVIVRKVAGYSTLGWFNDPLLSSQLAYSDYSLIRLVIHEAVHSTVWIPGSVRFNESLASFVEEEGSRRYFEKYRPESLGRIARYKEEREVYREMMRETARQLESVYSTKQSRSAMLEEKSDTIESLEFKLGSAEWKILNPERLLSEKYNNAHFLAFLTYESGEEYFARVFSSCEESMKCFLERMKSLDEPPDKWN